MAIEYTSPWNLPRIDLDHDATESVAAMKAMSTTLNGMFNYLVFDDDGNMVIDDETGTPILDL